MTPINAWAAPMAGGTCQPLGQQTLSGSRTGSPSAIATMLNFAARHQVLHR